MITLSQLEAMRQTVSQVLARATQDQDIEDLIGLVGELDVAMLDLVRADEDRAESTDALHRHVAPDLSAELFTMGAQMARAARLSLGIKS